MIRDEIQKNALAWVGTPFGHYQCLLGCGVDCAHLIIGVGKMTGILPPDFSVPYYSPTWYTHRDNNLLLDTLNSRDFRKKSLLVVLPGDILVFKIRKYICHVGIFLSSGMIVHAWNGLTRSKVTQRRIDLSTSNSIMYCFAYPGVGD